MFTPRWMDPGVTSRHMLATMKGAPGEWLRDKMERFNLLSPEERAAAEQVASGGAADPLAGGSRADGTRTRGARSERFAASSADTAYEAMPMVADRDAPHMNGLRAQRMRANGQLVYRDELPALLAAQQGGENVLAQPTTDALAETDDAAAKLRDALVARFEAVRALPDEHIDSALAEAIEARSAAHGTPAVRTVLTDALLDGPMETTIAALDHVLEPVAAAPKVAPAAAAHVAEQSAVELAATLPYA
jgi:hypothetical protein